MSAVVDAKPCPSEELEEMGVVDVRRMTRTYLEVVSRSVSKDTENKEVLACMR